MAAQIYPFRLAERVIEIVAAELDRKPESIRRQDDITETLGADPLDWVNIAIELEKEFCVKIDEEFCAQTHTVDELITGVLFLATRSDVA